MARKGRDISGWLVVDKPAGFTSTAVVNKVRWALKAKKAGHAGTLDPEATGVLAVALGEATKTVPYITDALKAYTFTVRLGLATNTDDAEGVNQTGFIGEQRAWKISHEQRKPRESFFRRGTRPRSAVGA